MPMTATARRAALAALLATAGVSLGPVATAPAAAKNRCLRDGYSAYRSYRGPVQIVATPQGHSLLLYACWAPSGRLSRLALAPRSPVGVGAWWVPKGGYAIAGRYLLFVARKSSRPPTPDRLLKVDVRAGRRRDLAFALRCPVDAPDPIGEQAFVVRWLAAPAINAHGSAAWACVTVDGLIQRMDARGVAVLDAWRIPPFGPFTAPVIRLRGTTLSWRIPGRSWRSARLVDKR